MNHLCDPKWAKPTERLPIVLRCARCGHRVLGDGTIAKPWTCASGWPSQFDTPRGLEDDRAGENE